MLSASLRPCVSLALALRGGAWEHLASHAFPECQSLPLSPVCLYLRACVYLNGPVSLASLILNLRLFTCASACVPESIYLCVRLTFAFFPLSFSFSFPLLNAAPLCVSLLIILFFHLHFLSPLLVPLVYSIYFPFSFTFHFLFLTVYLYISL